MTEPIKIKLSLTDYLDDLLGDDQNGMQCKRVKLSTATAIHALDSQEHYVHIEFKDHETDEDFEFPKVWRIKEWRTTYIKYQLAKKASEALRHELCVRDENTTKLMNSMAKMTGIDKEYFRALARKIAVKKDEKAANNVQTKIEI